MTALWRGGRTTILLALIANGIAQACAAIGAALAVRFAFVQLEAFDRNRLSDALIVAGALTVAGTTTATLRARERIDAERLGQSYVHDVRIHLFEHLTDMSPRAVSTSSRGATALRFVGDLTAIGRWVSLGVARLCVASTMAGGALIALAVLDPILAIACAAAVVTGTYGAIARGPAIRDASRTARRRRSRLAGRVTETIGAVGVVHADGAVDRERRRLRRQSRRLRDAMITRARHLGRLTAIAEATGAAATALLLVTAIGLGLGAPQVAAGMTIVGLLVPQLRGLARVQEYRQQQRVAVEAIERFLARPTLLTEPTTPRRLPSGEGRIELRGASLGVVRDIDVEAAAGTTVAVVGTNGAGKSTLLAMVARLVDVEAGSVRVDGVDLADVALADVRRAIGVAGPDLPLLRGSVRFNLTHADRDASADALAAVIERCGLAGVLAALPDGLDTRLTEGGANLSSGQRQRLLLARATLGAPRLLLLDEADANIDAATTSILERVLDAHLGTALVITHRRDRVARCDVVWHLDDGRLVEAGSPDELLSTRSRTSELFAARAPAPVAV